MTFSFAIVLILLIFFVLVKFTISCKSFFFCSRRCYPKPTHVNELLDIFPLRKRELWIMRGQVPSLGLLPESHFLSVFSESFTEFSCNKMNICRNLLTDFSQPCTRNCFSLMPSRSVTEQFLRIQMLFCYVPESLFFFYV